MAVTTQTHFATYRAAVTGDVINIGPIDHLFNGKSYSVRECQVHFQDQQAVGTSTIQVLDTDPNERADKDGVKPMVPAYVLASLGNVSGAFSYILRCGDDAGNGLIRVAQPGTFNIGDSAFVHLTFNNETVANKTQYVVFQGVEGDNVSVSVDSKSEDSYFGDFIGKIHDLRFYVQTEDGLSEESATDFIKILPIREPNVFGRSGLIDGKDVTGTIAAILDDETTVKYYELQSDKNLGLVYVYSGEKKLKHDESHSLTHCFPALKDGNIVSYFCLFENAKKTDDIIYYDLFSTNERLEVQKFSDVKSILAAKPMIADGRTCLLAVNKDDSRNVLCFDATHGFSKTDANKDTYFFSKTVKTHVNNEDCVLTFDKTDPTDFRFDDAAVFECPSKTRVFASFDLKTTYQTDSVISDVRSYMVLEAGQTPLCANDDELAYLTDKNTTLVFRGGKNRPGELIRIPLKVETTSIGKIHCGKDNIIILLESKKNTYLLDIHRGFRGDSFTRINSFIHLKDKQETMKVSTLNSAILYGQNKKGFLIDVIQYNKFLGLLRVVNKADTSIGNHKIDLVITNGKEKRKITYITELVADNSLVIEPTGKAFKDLKPDSNYKLRDYFKVQGQISSIESNPRVHSVYWWPDTVVFVNQKNGTSGASRFALGDVFVDTGDRTYTRKDGDIVKLEGDVLNPSRFLGNVNVDGKDVAFIIKNDGDTEYAQGWFLNRNGVVHGTEPVKLVGSFRDEGYRTPRVLVVGKDKHIGFYSHDGKFSGVKYRINPDDDSFAFVDTSSQTEGRWGDDLAIGDYIIKPSGRDAGVSSCAHFKVEGGDLDYSQAYSLCNITGGSSEKVIIRNLTTNPQAGTVSFDVINYPSESFGVNSITWWRIDSNLIGPDGRPVGSADFTYNATLKRKLVGLRDTDISKIYDFGDKIVILSSKEVNGERELYETYYGPAGDSPYSHYRYSTNKADWRWYNLDFIKVDNKIKRVYTNIDRNFNNVADIYFQEATLHLSKHVATDHVKEPFDLKFNDRIKIPSVLLSLDKYYADDHKTDDDDIKPPGPGPTPDPHRPDHHQRRSRLWIILGILLLIILIGAADLYLRRRSALAEAEAEQDRDKPRVVKKKKTGKNEGDISSSINEL